MRFNIIYLNLNSNIINNYKTARHMLTFGKAQIAQNQMPASYKQQFLTKTYQLIFQYNLLVFENEQFIDQDWNELFFYIRKIHHNYLQLSNQFSTIPRNILLPSYTKLTTLVLANNLIPTIQQLPYLDAPNLSKIDISANPITTIQSLSKAYWQIDHLQMRDVKIKQFTLSRIMTKKQSFFIILNFELYPINTQDLSILAKLQSQQLDSIGINSKKRINQKRVKEALAFKYTQVNFF